LRRLLFEIRLLGHDSKYLAGLKDVDRIKRHSMHAELVRAASAGASGHLHPLFCSRVP
jgi:hypothetical protein